MIPPREELTETVFHLLRDLVRRRIGFVVADAHRTRMESRLAADAAGVGSFYRLYTRLREEPVDGAGFGRLVDAAVNGETYFFRDEEGLSAFAGEIVPERLLAEGPGGSLDVWSAGCASGEEVYSLAVVLAERGLLSPRVRIRGTDASPGAIRRAREALYGPHSFRTTTPARLAAFFEARGDGRWRVRDTVRASASFDALAFRQETVDGPPFDVVVCRNVLMYLDPEECSRTVDLFASRLKPGGYLLLGPSDALAASSTPLTLVRLAREVAYRRPTGGGGT